MNSVPARPGSSLNSRPWPAGSFSYVFPTIALFLALSSIPYIYGHLSCPSDKEFLGIVGRDVQGSYMYFMWQVQAAEDRLLLTDRLTPEELPRFYFNPEWLVLGKLLRYSGLSLKGAFQLERAATIIFALLVIDYLLACFFTGIAERACVFLWIIFTSGLGWLFWIVQELSGRVWTFRIWDIEGINLFGYLINKPHFIRSLALMCLSYAWLLRGETSGKRFYFVLAGAAILVQGFIRPYDLPTAFLLLAFYPLLLSVQRGKWEWNQFSGYLLAGCVALPIIGYYGQLYTSSVFRKVFRGVHLEALSPLELVIWLGMPFLLAALGYDGVSNFRRWSRPVLFVYLWGLIVGMLIYSYPLVPWGMEAAGLCYVMAPILAGSWLFERAIPTFSGSRIGRQMAYIGFNPGRQTIVFGVLAVLVCVPSNVVFFGNMLKDLSSHSYPYYLPRDVTAGFDWLAKHAPRDAVVMATPQYGFYLPALAGVKCFAGHNDFTLDYTAKSTQALAFFDPAQTDGFRRQILQNYNVAYVFCYGAECSFIAGSPPEYLDPAFTELHTTIFRVDPSRL